ncbi:MAG: hypothetical protein D6681_22525 [Calditrichaeota bacterium]|nr:MAG: hypothetical protein D6681_22525 [Calditrichota bacterium]
MKCTNRRPKVFGSSIGSVLGRVRSLCLLLGVIFSASLWGQPQGRTLVVDSIAIQGNTKTRPQVILNYLTFRKGEHITREEVEANQRRLLQTNFFKDVELLVQPGSQKGHAYVVIKVRERYWPFLQFKSGFNELDGWYISPLGLRFDNIFGRGNIIGAELLIGDRVSSTHFEFIRPFLWGTEYDLEFRLFGTTREFLHFMAGERFRQEVRDGGLQIAIRGNSGLARYFSLAYVSQRVESDSFLTGSREGKKFRIDAPPYLPAAGDTQKIRRILVAFTVDTRDRPIHPTRGWWGAISFDQSATALGSFADYSRIIVDIRRYQRLWKQLIGAVRLKWGRVSQQAPFYEKFYLGGPNSLRGYDDRSLTPAGYAANLALGTVELRFPLSARLKDKSRLVGVLFYDAGYAWNRPDRLEPDRIRSGAGFGVRVRLPIVGMLRLDFAYPVPDNDLHVHLSLGHTF